MAGTARRTGAIATQLPLPAGEGPWANRRAVLVPSPTDSRSSRPGPVRGASVRHTGRATRPPSAIRRAHPLGGSAWWSWTTSRWIGGLVIGRNPTRPYVSFRHARSLPPSNGETLAYRRQQNRPLGADSGHAEEDVWWRVDRPLLGADPSDVVQDHHARSDPTGGRGDRRGGRVAQRCVGPDRKTGPGPGTSRISRTRPRARHGVAQGPLRRASGSASRSRPCASPPGPWSCTGRGSVRSTSVCKRKCSTCCRHSAHHTYRVSFVTHDLGVARQVADDSGATARQKMIGVTVRPRSSEQAARGVHASVARLHPRRGWRPQSWPAAH